MKTSNYNIEKIIESLYSRGYTNFLNQKELSLLKMKLHKKEYNIYELYEDSNKVVLYKKDIPNIKLLKIVSKIELRHQDILGTIFSLGIKEEMFGDIIMFNNSFYVFILPNLVDYLKYNINTIRNNTVNIEEVDSSIAQNFKKEYIKEEYVVSSLRIDNVISAIIKESRNKVLEHFKNKDIVLNSNDEIKPARTLKENDIFSIRKFGKYKYINIKKNTKKGSFIIEILKYK